MPSAKVKKPKKKKKKPVKVAKTKKTAKKKKTSAKPRGASMMGYMRDQIIAKPSVTTADLKKKVAAKFPDNSVIETNFPSIMARCRQAVIDSGDAKAKDIEAGKRRKVPTKVKKTAKKKKKAAKKKKK